MMIKKYIPFSLYPIECKDTKKALQLLSRLYRELKLRGALLESRKLILLPLETLYEEIEGVWNLSADQLKIVNRDSKFGEALIIQMSKQAGSYLLGFRIDPQERLHSVLKQVTSFHKHYMLNPILGIEVVNLVDEAQEHSEPTEVNEWMTEDSDDHRDLFAAYLADQTKLTDREPVYNEELGLAIEQLPDQYTIADLWNMFPPKDNNKDVI